MNEEQARRIGEKVAKELFVNGFGEKGNRLKLVEEKTSGRKGVQTTRDLGGWCEGAVRDRVMDAILLDQAAVAGDKT